VWSSGKSSISNESLEQNTLVTRHGFGVGFSFNLTEYFEATAKIPEIAFWWVFSLACVFAFFFSYGMVEDLIRTWYGNRQTMKQKPTSRIIDNSPDPRGNGHADYLLH